MTRVVRHLALALVLVPVLAASTASANTLGQYGFTGRNNSCLQCHGERQFPGLKLALSTTETLACWVEDTAESTDDNIVLKKLDLKALDYGQKVGVKVSIDEPTGDAAPQCPTSSCCEAAPPADALCNQEGFRVDGLPKEPGTCVQLFDDCSSGVNAGFNLEVVNGGAISLVGDGEGVRFEVATGDSVPGEQFSCLGGPSCSGLDVVECGNPQIDYQGGNPSSPVTCDAAACAVGQVGCNCALGDGYGCSGVDPNGIGACTKTVQCDGKNIFPNGCPTNATVTAEDAQSGYVTGCRCEDGYTLSPDPDEGGQPPYACVLATGTEVTHSIVKYFAGGPIEWNLEYTAPSEDEYTDAVEFWVGGNVANGNGYADQADLNSNYQESVAVGGNLPSFCATCADGSLPDDNGNCPGCGCSAAGGEEGPWAILGVAFAALVATRRRRR